MVLILYVVPCPWLDGKHTVFGEVVEQTPGLMESVEKLVASNSGQPKAKTIIKDCGEIKAK